MMTMIQRRQWLASLVAVAAWPTGTYAAAYPSSTVTIVVPFSAGGQFDGVARQVGKAMADSLGQSVIIENVSGAGGNIAASRVARAKPDGYTLLMYGGNHAVARSLYKKLDFDPLGDFAPISRVSVAPHVIMASPRLGVSSMAQLQERARTSRVSYGSPGVGTSMHLTFEIVKDHFGMDILHVPYKGGSNAMTDLMGGQIDLAIIAVGPALEFIRAGKVVPLAVTSRDRSQALPKVPSLSEVGMVDFDAGSWSAFVAPRQTPADVVARLNTAVRTALAAPEVRRLFEEQSFMALPGIPEELRQFMQGEARRYAPIIQKLNLAQ
jgi:tripartite-type tricarboxylate transporter receptor subunit TctC